jgi:hypothetical protein
MLTAEITVCYLEWVVFLCRILRWNPLEALTTWMIAGLLGFALALAVLLWALLWRGLRV